MCFMKIERRFTKEFQTNNLIIHKIITVNINKMDFISTNYRGKTISYYYSNLNGEIYFCLNVWSEFRFLSTSGHQVDLCVLFVAEDRMVCSVELYFRQFPINAAKNLILIMFSFTLDIYCTSVRPGRGIPHMWLSLRFLLSFYLLKGFFSSFSFLLLRVKGRGCHTLLKPYETNCGLWIWAIQIKFDWLIDFICCHCFLLVFLLKTYSSHFLYSDTNDPLRLSVISMRQRVFALNPLLFTHCFA